MSRVVAIAVSAMVIAFSNMKCEFPSDDAQDYVVSNTTENVEVMETDCLLQPINTLDYAYVDGENRYGNPLESSLYLHRRIVSNGEKVFGGINSLFCCNLDGSDKEIIYNSTIGQVSFYNGWIYFSDANYYGRVYDSYYLYRIRPDGSDFQTIYDSSDDEYGMFMGFYIVNDRIFIEESGRIIEGGGERFGIQSMSLTGENIVNVIDKRSFILYIGDRLYAGCEDGVYCMDYDGSNRRIVYNKTYMDDIIMFDEDYIYYHNPNEEAIYRFKLDSGTSQLVIDGIRHIEYLFVKDDYMYYVYSYLDTEMEAVRYTLSRVLVAGEGEEELVLRDVNRKKHTTLTPTVIGDWIYCDGGSLEGQPYVKVKLDGSEEVSISSWFTYY